MHYGRGRLLRESVVNASDYASYSCVVTAFRPDLLQAQR
jgi:hypothetical protein